MVLYGIDDIIGSLLGGLSMLITMLLPVIVIVGIVYIGLNWAEKKKNVSTEETSMPDPLNVLKKRYANGEISLEEFGLIKGDLHKV